MTESRAQDKLKRDIQALYESIHLNRQNLGRNDFTSPERKLIRKYIRRNLTELIQLLTQLSEDDE